jgi:hypothetical protein
VARISKYVLATAYYVTWLLENSETGNYTHCMGWLTKDPETINSLAELSE